MNTKQKLAEIQARLDQSTSDPIWLNEALAEVAALVDLEASGASQGEQVDSDEPLTPLQARLLADDVQTLTFADVAAMACMADLLQNASLVNMTEESLRLMFRPIAQAAMIGGQELRNVRAIMFLNQDKVKRAAEAPAEEVRVDDE